MARTFNLADVKFTVTPEGEDQTIESCFDESLWEAVHKELEKNLWGFCCVRVDAEWGGFKGTNYLGAVSIGDEAEGDEEKYFREVHGYFPQMKDEAVQDLLKNISAAGWEINVQGE
jgi:hypothetical protein